METGLVLEKAGRVAASVMVGQVLVMIFKFIIAVGMIGAIVFKLPWG